MPFERIRVPSKKEARPSFSQPEALVANAAVEGLLMIGKGDDHAKGQVARKLVERWRGAEDQLEQRLRIAMVQLAGIDYGEDEQPWIEWAQRLP